MTPNWVVSALLAAVEPDARTLGVACFGVAVGPSCTSVFFPWASPGAARPRTRLARGCRHRNSVRRPRALVARGALLARPPAGGGRPRLPAPPCPPHSSHSAYDHGSKGRKKKKAPLSSINRRVAAQRVTEVPAQIRARTPHAHAAPRTKAKPTHQPQLPPQPLGRRTRSQRHTHHRTSGAMQHARREDGTPKQKPTQSPAASTA